MEHKRTKSFRRSKQPNNRTSNFQTLIKFTLHFSIVLEVTNASQLLTRLPLLPLPLLPRSFGCHKTMFRYHSNCWINKIPSWKFVNDLQRAPIIFRCPKTEFWKGFTTISEHFSKFLSNFFLANPQKNYKFFV